jgi:uncharacterized protein YbjT (DUF2867 family)
MICYLFLKFRRAHISENLRYISKSFLSRRAVGLQQPIVSDDVAAALADVAIAEPLNDTIELAGPEPLRMDELIRRYLVAKGDSREVITDPEALYRTA